VDKLPHARYVGEIQMTFPVELGVIAKLLAGGKISRGYFRCERSLNS
jgi:hypothetical protein